MFQSTVCGNLGRDAEVKTLQSGSAVCEFSVGVNRRRNDQDETVWVRCQIWGERGKSLAPHLTKGKKVCATGRMWCSIGSSDDGRVFLNCDLNVAEIEFMSAREQAPQQSAQPHPTQYAQPYQQAPQAPLLEADEDIPF